VVDVPSAELLPPLPLQRTEYWNLGADFLDVKNPGLYLSWCFFADEVDEHQTQSHHLYADATSPGNMTGFLPALERSLYALDSLRGRPVVVKAFPGHFGNRISPAVDGLNRLNLRTKKRTAFSASEHWSFCMPSQLLLNPAAFPRAFPRVS
jgi:hypothetical protein